MPRNTLLLLCSLIAVIVGLLVSYFPPAQNAVSIWSLVSMAVGYGIRDLFAADAPAAPAASTPDLQQAAAPAPTAPQ